jgi:hypothetical protein
MVIGASRWVHGYPTAHERLAPARESLTSFAHRPFCVFFFCASAMERELLQPRAVLALKRTQPGTQPRIPASTSKCLAQMWPCWKGRDLTRRLSHQSSLASVARSVTTSLCRSWQPTESDFLLCGRHSHPP